VREGQLKILKLVTYVRMEESMGPTCVLQGVTKMDLCAMANKVPIPKRAKYVKMAVANIAVQLVLLKSAHLVLAVLQEIPRRVKLVTMVEKFIYVTWENLRMVLCVLVQAKLIVKHVKLAAMVVLTFVLWVPSDQE